MHKPLQLNLHVKIILLMLVSMAAKAADIDISGPTYVCPDQDYSYTASASNIFGDRKGSFEWTFWRNNQIIGSFGFPIMDCPGGPGSSTSTITFNWGSVSGAVKIRVRFKGVNDILCHFNSPSEKWYNVTVRNFNPGPISGSLLFCASGETQQLSIPGITPFNSPSSCYFHHKYDWIVPDGWSVVPADGTGYVDIEGGIRTFAKTVLLTAPSTPLIQGYEGNYNVSVKTEPAWPYTGTTTRKIWVGPPREAHYSQIYISGFYGENPITLAKDALYQFNIEPVDGAVSYSWVLPPGFSFMSNQNTTYESVNIWTGNQSGTFILKCYPQGICSSGITCPPGQICDVTSTGYSSLYINLPGPGSGGGSGTPGCEEPPCLVPQPLRVYPNPVKGQLTISLGDEFSSLTKDDETEIILHNKFQQKVYSSKTTNSEIVILTANLPNDIYYLTIQNKNRIIRRQISVDN
jgi:hypothetical protein